jgi:hypothetical protein
VTARGVGSSIRCVGLSCSSTATTEDDDRSTDLSKCHGAMRTYERSNVTVDQRTECRDLFDRASSSGDRRRVRMPPANQRSPTGATGSPHNQQPQYRDQEHEYDP